MVSLLKKVSNAPTGVPFATMHWLEEAVRRGQETVYTDRVVITPGVAAEILNRNPDNRNLSPTKAEHYALDMAAGRWSENGETIIVSKDGLLNDGQHRMQALIDANVSLPFLFVFGVDRSTRTTVDQGRARSAGDYLSMGGTQYAKNASTAAKWIIAYERSDGRSISQRAKITNAEIVARVRADPEIVASCAFAFHDYMAYRSLFSLTTMAVCHYILSEVDKDDAKAYLSEVAVGENIKRGDPAFAVRAAFLSANKERQEGVEIILHGWNAWRQGRPLKVAKSYGSLPALI